MTNEPTTGEMIAIMRGERDTQKTMPRVTLRMLVDRLESQEAQIKQLAEALAYANEWHKDSVENATNELRELSGIAGELEAMTARAESAEREQDAAIAYMKRFGCLTCEGQGTIGANEPCWGCRDKSNWKMRGLQPQDGGAE